MLIVFHIIKDAQYTRNLFVQLTREWSIPLPLNAFRPIDAKNSQYPVAIDAQTTYIQYHAKVANSVWTCVATRCELSLLHSLAGEQINIIAVTCTNNQDEILHIEFLY